MPSRSENFALTTSTLKALSNMTRPWLMLFRAVSRRCARNVLRLAVTMADSSIRWNVSVAETTPTNMNRLIASMAR